MARATTKTKEPAEKKGLPATVEIERADEKNFETLSRGLVETGASHVAAIDPDDEESLARAEHFLTGRVMAARKRLKAIFDPICDAAHKAWKKTTDTRKELDDPLAKLERELKEEIEAARAEIDRREQAAADAEAAEQKRLAEEAAEREAKALEAEGQKDVAEAVREEVKAVPAAAFRPAVAPSAPSAGSNLSFREEWYAEVTDLRALARAVADGTAPLSYLEAALPNLNMAAKATKKVGVLCPGVVVKMRRAVAGRAR